MKKLLISLLAFFPFVAFASMPNMKQVISLKISNGHYVGHNIKKLPSRPLTATWDGETLYFDFAHEDGAEVTIFTLDGEQIGNYIISPEENSVTLSSDTPESFVIQIAVGDAVYEGIVEG